jgi:CO/xanthine dehydrogenase Mo-binding subunit
MKGWKETGMATLSLEERVTRLEEEVAALKAGKPGPRDWMTTVGMFDGDETLHAVFQEALKLREADRAKARKKYARKPRTRK